MNIKFIASFVFFGMSLCESPFNEYDEAIKNNPDLMLIAPAEKFTLWMEIRDFKADAEPNITPNPIGKFICDNLLREAGEMHKWLISQHKSNLEMIHVDELGYQRVKKEYQDYAIYYKGKYAGIKENIYQVITNQLLRFDMGLAEFAKVKFSEKTIANPNRKYQLSYDQCVSKLRGATHSAMDKINNDFLNSKENKNSQK